MKAPLVAAALLAWVSTFASANTAIVAGTGWHDVVVNAANTASVNSDWTFSVASGTEYFRVVDCCIVGDVYKLWQGGVGGTLLATSTFYAGAPTSNPAGGYESYWLDASCQSKLEYAVGPGNYMFTISGNGASGARRATGPRAGPETYALMLAGLAAVGFVARRRNS